MRFERNNTVSSDPCYNIYQFPSRTDSDILTTPWMDEIARLHRHPGSPLGGNSLLPPRSRSPSLGRTTPGWETLHASNQALLTTATLRGASSTKRGLPLLQASSASTPAPTAQPEQPMEPILHPVRTNTRTGSSMPGRHCLATLLRSLLLGLMIAPSVTTPQCVVLGSLVGLLPVTTANRFALKNGYSTVEARYHLTAYDCSDPSEVKACSSIPASHCSIRATPVQKDRPTLFQLLQKEKKRYLTAYACFLFRTDIR